MNNSPIHTVTRRVSRKLLRYLLMSFVCDVIIRVSFKVSFPHLYALEVWKSRVRSCYKR